MFWMRSVYKGKENAFRDKNLFTYCHN